MWNRIGDVPNYIEPFAGSLAVLLDRPHWDADAGGWAESSVNRAECVNDLDGTVTNFWRAVKHDPERTASWSDNTVHELELHARHLWLHRRLKSTDGLNADALAYSADKGVLPFAAWLTTSPDAYDCQVAGWWAWGLSSWIGDNWCRPWKQQSLPHLGNAGRGVNRKRPHLGNAGRGVNRQLPHLGSARGVNRQLPHLGSAGRGECARRRANLIAWFQRLADRLRGVDVCCGDWERICNPSVTRRGTPCGVFIDPPYSQDAGLDTVYLEHDPGVSSRVRQWCIERGADTDLRIALCGYDTEHSTLAQHGWTVTAWKATGGYGNQGDNTRGKDNAHRERIWWSHGCIPEAQTKTLWD